MSRSRGRGRNRSRVTSVTEETKNFGRKVEINLGCRWCVSVCIQSSSMSYEGRTGSKRLRADSVEKSVVRGFVDCRKLFAFQLAEGISVFRMKVQEMNSRSQQPYFPYEHGLAQNGLLCQDARSSAHFRIGRLGSDRSIAHGVRQS
jgi:hypothetical protein